MDPELHRSKAPLIAVLAGVIIFAVIAVVFMLSNRQEQAPPTPVPVVTQTLAGEDVSAPAPTASQTEALQDPTQTPSATPTEQIPTEDPVRTDPSSASQGLSPAGMDPQELVSTAAELMTTWDTASDRSPTDGYRRALPLFVDEYEQLFTTPENPTVDDAWMEASRHEATSTPKVEIVSTSEVDGVHHYSVMVTWTWNGSDGYTKSSDQHPMTFIVKEDNGGYIIQNWSEGMIQ